MVELVALTWCRLMYVVDVVTLTKYITRTHTHTRIILFVLNFLFPQTNFTDNFSNCYYFLFFFFYVTKIPLVTLLLFQLLLLSFCLYIFNHLTNEMSLAQKMCVWEKIYYSNSKVGRRLIPSQDHAL